MEQRISKAELSRQWARRCKEAEEYLEGQPLDYQPLVTDCYVDSDGNVVKAKELFDQRKEEYMKKRNELIGETVSRIRALIREQHLTVFSGFAKTDPARYHQSWNQRLREKKSEEKVSGKDLLRQLKLGAKEELEHTNDKKKALQIAADHLSERPDYYNKMKKAGLAEQRPETEPETIPREPETTPETEPDTQPEPKKWSPFNPDRDPDDIPDPKDRRKN